MSCILWNSKVDHIHNRPPCVPMPSHINQVSAILPYFFDIHFNIILPSWTGMQSCLLSFKFPHQNSAYTSLVPHMCHLPCTSHLPQSDHPIKCKSWRCPLCNFLHPAVSSSLSGPITFLSHIPDNMNTELLYTSHYWHFALLTIYSVVIFKTMC
jgi:hypothetical protein